MPVSIISAVVVAAVVVVVVGAMVVVILVVDELALLLVVSDAVVGWPVGVVGVGGGPKKVQLEPDVPLTPLKSPAMHEPISVSCR